MSEKQHAHELIERLPDSQIATGGITVRLGACGAVMFVMAYGLAISRDHSPPIVDAGRLSGGTHIAATASRPKGDSTKDRWKPVSAALPRKISFQSQLLEQGPETYNGPHSPLYRYVMQRQLRSVT